jgi:hypothetical protein
MKKIIKSTKKWYENSMHRFALLPADALLDSRLNAQHIRFLLIIAAHAQIATGICIVTQAALGEWLSKSNGEPLSERQVRNLATELRDFGWLRFKRIGPHCPNRYQLVLPELAESNLRTITDRKIDDVEYTKKMEKIHADQKAFSKAKTEALIDEQMASMADYKPYSSTDSLLNELNTI